MDYNSILGVVLAGGQSKRFGQDKSQVQLESKILIVMYQYLESKGCVIRIPLHDGIWFEDSNNICKISLSIKGLSAVTLTITSTFNFRTMVR